MCGMKVRLPKVTEWAFGLISRSECLMTPRESELIMEQSEAAGKRPFTYAAGDGKMLALL